MKDIDITARDSDIDVILGPYKSGEDARPEALASVKYLYTDLTDIRKYYVRLGFHLEEFACFGYFRDLGYATLEDFCEKNLGLDKGAVSRCINVYKTFNASNDVTYKAGIKTVGCAMDLSERWKDYSYTQLCEMLPLSDEERKDITPDMTVKDIREYKRQIKDAVQLRQRNRGRKREKFDQKKYDLSGLMVRQDIIRKCSPVKDAVVTVFDREGRMVYGNIWCELIYAGNDRYYFRLYQEADEEEEEDI